MNHIIYIAEQVSIFDIHYKGWDYTTPKTEIKKDQEQHVICEGQ